ncbi:MAG: NupC/NupG family nucleoside CNT transporter [Alphaproteobacteria bacterium]|nr:NupC/NupG family nucleoside CNT transporter [Alphaproteobacteria bacterium]
MTYSLDNARSLLGVLAILFIAWVLSEDKKRFPWAMTIGAVGVQAALVAALFAFPEAQPVVTGINGALDGLAAATQQGTNFVFSYLSGLPDAQPYVMKPAPDGSNGAPPFIFAFQVLPLILVISALSAVLWHWGILKIVIRAFGFIFQKSMGIGGASATATAANIFMGMVESPIVIRGYLDKLTRSEIFMMMVVGLGTVAGSTMVAYALMLAPTLPNAGAHVLVASIISAPAAVLLARIIIPETPGQGGKVADYTSSLKYDSTMDAITRGTQDGLSVVLNIAATLLVFVALVAIVNSMLAAIPPVGGAPLTLERIFGFAFAPAAYLIGVPWNEAQKAGDLLGAKLFLTEFVAYLKLGAIPAGEMTERTRMIMTYALCGFANVGSVGIMVSGMTLLFPPEKRGEILDLAWKSLLPGVMTTMMTAAIVAAMPEAMFAGR